MQRAMAHRLAQNRKMARRAFRFRDMDNTGPLGPEEVRKMVASFMIEMTDEDFKVWWATVDADGSGEVRRSAAHVSLLSGVALGGSVREREKISMSF